MDVNTAIAKPTTYILDVKGRRVKVGDYVRCIAHNHNWVDKGEIVKVEYLRNPSGARYLQGFAYRSMRNSTSTISAEVVEKVTDKFAKKQFELSAIQIQIENTENRIKFNLDELCNLQFERGRLKAEVDKLRGV